MTWRSPDTYHSAGNGRGTATFKFYEGRGILKTFSDRAATSYGLEAWVRVPPSAVVSSQITG